MCCGTFEYSHSSSVDSNDENHLANSLNGRSTVKEPNKKPPLFYGFVAVLKDNFGFIETLKHDEEAMQEIACQQKM